MILEEALVSRARFMIQLLRAFEVLNSSTIFSEDGQAGDSFHEVTSV